MSLTGAQKVKLINKIIEKVRREIEVSIENDLFDEVLQKYEINLDDDSYLINPKIHKILVLGSLSGKINDFKLAAKKMGLNPEQLDFIYDYKDLKRFNAAKLEYSMEYSDIIYGPNPHKQKGMGDTSSLLAEMKREPNRFPKVIEATANQALKITMTNFKMALMKTRLLESSY